MSYNEAERAPFLLPVIHILLLLSGGKEKSVILREVWQGVVWCGRVRRGWG